MLTPDRRPAPSAWRHDIADPLVAGRGKGRAMRLACQEQLLPGDTLEAKWDASNLKGDAAGLVREVRSGVWVPSPLPGAQPAFY